MGFEFDERAKLIICGQEYTTDISDVGFIESLITDFTAIMQKYHYMENFLQKMVSKKQLTPEELQKETNRLTDDNAEIIDHARCFIVSVLGEEAYTDIFSQRKANSTEHIKLCAYIYEETLKSREKIVQQYLKTSENRSERRVVARPAKNYSGRRKRLPN